MFGDPMTADPGLVLEVVAWRPHVLVEEAWAVAALAAWKRALPEVVRASGARSGHSYVGRCTLRGRPPAFFSSVRCSSGAMRVFEVRPLGDGEFLVVMTRGDAFARRRGAAPRLEVAGEEIDTVRLRAHDALLWIGEMWASQTPTVIENIRAARVPPEEGGP